MAEQLICRAEEIADDTARGFIARVDGKQRNVFLVRRAGTLYGYLNCCPHAQALLDMIPGQFFNPDGTLLRCSTHGAMFRVEDGECVFGPCVGERLHALDITIRDGDVVLQD